MPRTDFRLSKWYVDCVGEDGECAIAYHAELSWGPIALGYASLLRRGAAFVILLAVAWHHGDVAQAAAGRASYWEARYDRERAKYRKLIRSLIDAKREKR